MGWRCGFPWLCQGVILRRPVCKTCIIVTCLFRELSNYKNFKIKIILSKGNLEAAMKMIIKLLVIFGALLAFTSCNFFDSTGSSKSSSLNLSLQYAGRTLSGSSESYHIKITAGSQVLLETSGNFNSAKHSFPLEIEVPANLLIECKLFDASGTQNWQADTTVLVTSSDPQTISLVLHPTLVPSSSSTATLSSSSSQFPYVPTGSDLLVNGDFSQDMTAWQGPATLVGGPNVSGSAVNGVFSFYISSVASVPEPWHVQVTQANILLESTKKYRLEFIARGDSHRQLQVVMSQSVDPWAEYHDNGLVTLSQNYELYQVDFTMEAQTDPAARLTINVGMEAGNLYIKEIHLYQIQ
jgi:hypothetical protein